MKLEQHSHFARMMSRRSSLLMEYMFLLDSCNLWKNSSAVQSMRRSSELKMIRKKMES